MSIAIQELAREERITMESLINDIDEMIRVNDSSRLDTTGRMVDIALVEMEDALRSGGQDAGIADSELIRTGYEPNEYQTMIAERMQYAQFTVLVCHRRFGKTVFAVNALVHSALLCRRPMPRYGYCAPYLKQARQIAWLYLKRAALSIPGSRKNETDLYVEFANGARITLYGADNAEAMRGLYFDGFVEDEPADIKAYVWQEIILPLLSDRQGWCLFIGTPKGLNFFCELYERAQGGGVWLAMIFRESETDLAWLSKEFLYGVIKPNMPESAWSQEYECSFAASSGNVVMSIELVSEAMSRSVPNEGYLRGTEKVLGIDCADEGDDRSVIVRRWGHLIFKPKVYGRQDPMAFVGQIIAEIKDFQPDIVFIDRAVGGNTIRSMLEKMGHRVVAVNFGAAASNTGEKDSDGKLYREFRNKRAEMYFDFKKWLESGGVLPDDVGLKAELTAHTYFHDEARRVCLHKKQEVKEILSRSPDIADACVLTVAFPVDTKELRAVRRRSGFIGNRKRQPWHPFVGKN